MILCMPPGSNARSLRSLALTFPFDPFPESPHLKCKDIIGRDSRDVSFCLELVRPLFKSVRLCLFDRGFYSNELMIALDKMTVPYLIFVPKNDAAKRALVPMRSGDTRTIEHEFTFNRDRTVIRSSTTYTLLRQIYAKRLKMSLDWCFANQSAGNRPGRHNSDIPRKMEHRNGLQSPGRGNNQIKVQGRQDTLLSLRI